MRAAMRKTCFILQEFSNLKYNKLGGSDLTVSRLVLGTMTFGEMTPESDAHRMLDLAVDRGVTTLDAAEIYPSPPKDETQGETERIIGRWMAARGNRDKVVLASKVTGRSGHSNLRPWGGPARLDRRSIEAALDASLTRLGTDYVDLYQLHWPDRKTTIFGRTEYRHDPDDTPVPLEETLDALGDLMKAGKIRAIGMSNETPWGLMRAQELARGGRPRVVSIQNAYNLLNRLFDNGLSEICHLENVSLLAYSPLAMGLLTGKYRSATPPADARLVRYRYYDRYTVPRAMEAAAAYADMAERHGLDPARMALAFLLERPYIGGVIVGATTAEQLESNLAAADLTLSDAVRKDINVLHRRIPNPCP